MRVSLANVRHIRLKIIPSGEEGRERHKRHTYVGEDVILREVGDHRLHKNDDRADHLGYGLDLAKHRRGNYDTALARYDKSKRGNAKLAKKDHKHYPHEDERLSGLCIKHHPNKDSNR